MEIAEDPKKAWNLTIKKNSVAVVSDGTAVLGLGDIGPYAAMPVMEGKAMLFKEFADIDAYPICLDTKDPEEIIKIVKAIAPGFGGNQFRRIFLLPAVSRLNNACGMRWIFRSFMMTSNGTAVVVTAALINALKVVKKSFRKIKIVVCGAGAAGYACTKMLKQMGVKNIIVCDRSGAIYKGRPEHMNPLKTWFGDNTNKEVFKGSVAKALENADVFIGVSGPGVIKPTDLKKMAKDAIVFALSNPTPEIMPEEARKYVRIMATGRSDYPNQINNVLAFPRHLPRCPLMSVPLTLMKK